MAEMKKKYVGEDKAIESSPKCLHKIFSINSILSEKQMFCVFQGIFILPVSPYEDTNSLKNQLLTKSLNS